MSRKRCINRVTVNLNATAVEDWHTIVQDREKWRNKRNNVKQKKKKKEKFLIKNKRYKLSVLNSDISEILAFTHLKIIIRPTRIKGFCICSNGIAANAFNLLLTLFTLKKVFFYKLLFFDT